MHCLHKIATTAIHFVIRFQHALQLRTNLLAGNKMSNSRNVLVTCTWSKSALDSRDVLHYVSSLYIHNYETGFFMWLIRGLTCWFEISPVRNLADSRFLPKNKSKRYANIRKLSTQNPNPALKTKREMPNITNSQKTKSEHMVNQVSSYFPKDCHSATQIELKIIRKHVLLT